MNLNVADFNTGTKTPAEIEHIGTILIEEIYLIILALTTVRCLYLIFTTYTKSKIRTSLTKDGHTVTQAIATTKMHRYLQI